MDDVLTGSFFLTLLCIAGIVGRWMRSVRQASTLAFVLPVPARTILPARANSPANQPARPIERWLARAKRVTHAPSSDDAGAICDAPSDPPVVRLTA